MESLFTAPKRKGLGLTPLVDVVFILLLFFMLSSSFVRHQQLSLASPVASDSVDIDDPQRVAISEIGELFFWGGNQVINDQQLVSRFDLHKPLLISSREQTLLQDIVSVLVHLDKLGFTQVSIGPLWLGDENQQKNETSF